MAGPEYGDAQAATQSGSSSGRIADSRLEAEAEATEEAGARQIGTNERRTAALTAHLERESERGFVVETRSDTQAIVVRRRSRFARLIRPRGAERRVLSVDEHGEVTARTATPVRW